MKQKEKKTRLNKANKTIDKKRVVRGDMHLSAPNQSMQYRIRVNNMLTLHLDDNDNKSNDNNMIITRNNMS